MKQLVAAFAGGALAAVLAGGLIYNNYQNYKLSANISEVLAEFLIAGKSLCKQNNCEIVNVVSPYFKADKIEIINVSDLLGYLKYRDIQYQFLSKLSNSWFKNLRGSKFWWMIYDSNIQSKPNYQIKVYNLKTSFSTTDPLMLILSADSRLILMNMNRGFSANLISYEGLHTLTINSFIDRYIDSSFSYELENGNSSCDGNCPLDTLLKEIDSILQLGIKIK